jgi:hypothetical protein
MSNDLKNGLIVAGIAVFAYVIYKNITIKDKPMVEPEIKQPIESVMVNMPAPLSV